MHGGVLMGEAVQITDPLERVIRPIVEGQIRGFAKEHPGVLNGVTWYKGKKQDVFATFVGSVSKRVVRDIICSENRHRIEAAFFEIWENERSAVAPPSAADGAKAGTHTGPTPALPVAWITAVDDRPGGTVPAGAGPSASLLPAISWGA